MSDNSNLNRAQAKKDDEFFTRYDDVAKEMRMHADELKGKYVYCPCDGPESAFYRYFRDNYENTGIHKVVATKYNPGDLGRICYYAGFNEAQMFLGRDGDFRGPEAREMMETCDIVISNPPFSLIIPFVKQIMEIGRDFLIVCHLTAFKSNYIFQLFKDGIINPGYNSIKCFDRPDDREETFGNVLWMTTLPSAPVQPHMEFSRSYSPESFPTYDDYDAIEVGKVKDIPGDYRGLMGVPTRFLYVFNREQFELVDLIHPRIGDRNFFARFVIKFKDDYFPPDRFEGVCEDE